VACGSFGKILFFPGSALGGGWKLGMDGLAEDDFGLAAAKTKPILPFGELAFNAGGADFELVGTGDGVFGVRASETAREISSQSAWETPSGRSM